MIPIQQSLSVIQSMKAKQIAFVGLSKAAEVVIIFNFAWDQKLLQCRQSFIDGCLSAGLHFLILARGS